MRWVDATVVATGAGADSPVESGRPGMSCLGDAMIRLQPRDPPSVSPYRVSRPSGPRNAVSRNPSLGSMYDSMNTAVPTANLGTVSRLLALPKQTAARRVYLWWVGHGGCARRAPPGPVLVRARGY